MTGLPERRIIDDMAAQPATVARPTIRELAALGDLEEVYALFDRIWQPDRSNPPVTVEHLRALTHAGNYVAGAYDGDELIGACVGFFAAPPGRSMHSHVAGVSSAARGRHVGFALKAHQRDWALERGLSEITWTFDPLVRRNAYFNLAKLQARPGDYLVDFYGDMDDAINGGQGSDRLLMRWRLDAPEVVAAVAAGGGTGAVVPSDAVAALAESPSGRALAAPRSSWARAARVTVATPPDIEALRAADPAAARQWRGAMRDVLGELIGDGARVSGFTRSGTYVVERTDT
ncbi:Predicted acetyltransferase, GNAT superfamily [Jiangella alba]|uniref:Predicted acetyltransferase, GNAT superfamily n=2 Tax=Jiangella alba TaxID=561176 RepID=A0A1H5PYP9_9ACTN|nr:Predicted acetyltransferase, GNAT superfamily [Jiangella alba]